MKRLGCAVKPGAGAWKYKTRWPTCRIWSASSCPPNFWPG